MTPSTIAALNWLSFAALIVSGIGCLVCAGWMLTMIRLGRDLILTCRTIAPGKVRVWVLKKEGHK